MDQKKRPVTVLSGWWASMPFAKRIRYKSFVFDPHSTYRSRWDAIGISASLVCAVHCVVLPFFLSSLPFLGVELLKNTLIEAVIIGISLCVGSWALLTGYRKRHRRLWTVLLFAVGMLVLMGDTLWVSTRSVDMAGKAIAACCITTAHIFNWKYANRPKPVS